MKLTFDVVGGKHSSYLKNWERNSRIVAHYRVRNIEIQMIFPHIYLTCRLLCCIQGLLQSSSIRSGLMERTDHWFHVK